MPMCNERKSAIIAEFNEAETPAEFKAIWCDLVANHPECAANHDVVLAIKANVPRIRKMQVTPDPTDVGERIAEAKRQLEELLLKTGAVRGVPKPPVQPAKALTGKYKLLNTEVRWCSTPQVHAIVQILAAHAKVGDVLHESDIVEMMVRNEHVLETKQGGQRIWDYYKGKHNRGLEAHGNIEKVG